MKPAGDPPAPPLLPGRSLATGTLAVALLGAALVYWATPYGAGLGPDSVYYVAAARAVLAGDGVRSLDGGLLTHFPPLYPLVLAAGAWVSGADPLEAARWVNLLLFAVLLVFAGGIAARVGRHPGGGVAAALVLLVSQETVKLHAMAFSEPLAIVLGTGGLVLVARYIRTRRTSLLVFGAVAVGLAALTRYAAVAYAITAAAGLLVLDRDKPVGRRAALAATFGSLAAAPLVLWWLRTGARIGVADRTLDFYPVRWSDLAETASIIAGWIAPPDALSALSGGLVLLLVAGWAAWMFHRADPRSRLPGPVASVLLLFAVVYIAVVIACRMLVDPAIPLGGRMLGPVQVALVIAAAGLLARWAQGSAATDAAPTSGGPASATTGRRSRPRLALAAILLVVLGAQATATARWAWAARTDGLVYTKRSVRTSALLERVRAVPATVPLWSNAPDLLYIQTGRCAHWLPKHALAGGARPNPLFDAEWSALLGQADAHVVWFNAFAWRSYLPAESELNSAPSVAAVVSFEDGTLYRIVSSGGEPVASAAETPCPLARRHGSTGASTSASGVGPRGGEPPLGWPQYGGDPGGMRYSPLADINRSNVARLELAWRWRTGEQGWHAGPGAPLIAPGKFEVTPLMIGDTLFLTTPNHRVVALDAETGAQLWTFDPRAREGSEARRGHRFVHRGVAAWSDGGRRRLFYASRGWLYALDAATGAPLADFGRSGRVDLLEATGWSGNPNHVDNTAPPTVYHDLVIVGSSISDDVTYPGDPPGAVLAFDVRSGHRRWMFRTIPRPGEPGSQSWQQGTRKAGHANVWAPMTVDTARGLLYLPVSAASNDYYGGRRHGADLFSESLVCLDASTGKRKWHFQTVHHGLWDYDLPGPPLLATVRRGERTQDIVAVAGKTGFVYVFDRVTGKPVWPIEERPVPQSDVPGEATSPTQPFPTKPAPFVRQGISANDLVDFTPLLRDSVRALLRGVRFGPLFTPPALAGTAVMPGPIGGAAWGGPAYDPASQLLFVKGNNQPSVVRLAPLDHPDSETDAAFVPLLRRGWSWPIPPNPAVARPSSQSGAQRSAPELPFGKPPYGTVTAIDLTTGEQRWQVTVGNWPELSEHPAVRGVKLPPLGAVGTSGPTVTRGGLVFISGGSTSLHALDAATGRELWEAPLHGRGEANPMTYRTRTGRQFVVIASSRSKGGELLAFSLPPR